jgi:DUF4097 and DUF4098 domain-containing protein YvlB
MRDIRFFIACSAVAVTTLSRIGVASASEQIPVFQRILPMDIKEPATLSIAVSGGDVDIAYSHENQIAVYAFGKDAGGKDLPVEFFGKTLFIEQKGNSVSIRDSIGADSLLSSLYSINYRVDVPRRTTVDSVVSGIGNQSLLGVTGPAKLASGAGDITAQYVTSAAIDARTGKGNISCIRVFEVNAETGEGNITLMEDGNSKAVVKRGRGKIEVGGARGTVDGSTDAGTLHIRAVPWGDWQLKSSSGNIRIELPPKAKVDVEASSGSGEVEVGRDDMQNAGASIHHLHQQVNGGGKHVVARNIRGRISIE